MTAFENPTNSIKTPELNNFEATVLEDMLKDLEKKEWALLLTKSTFPNTFSGQEPLDEVQRQLQDLRKLEELRSRLDLLSISNN